MMTRGCVNFYSFIALFAAGAVAVEWTHLHVTFNTNHPIPLTKDELLKSDPKYTLMAVDKEMNVELYSYGKDPSVSVMVDSYGHVAGVRASYIKENLAKRAASNGLAFNYTFHDKPTFTGANYWGMDVWYSDILYINPEKLKAGGRQSLNGLAAEEAWVKIGGKWTQMPKDECLATSLGFVKQGCSGGMGMHYVLKGEPLGDCSVLEPAFLLYENSSLVGVGLSPFGNFENIDRHWYEDLPMALLKIDVPLAPPCFYDWAQKYGSPVLHTYMVERPKKLSCGLPYQDPKICGTA